MSASLSESKWHDEICLDLNRSTCTSSSPPHPQTDPGAPLKKKNGFNKALGAKLASISLSLCVGHMGHKACPNLVSLLNKEHPTITEIDQASFKAHIFHYRWWQQRPAFAASRSSSVLLISLIALINQRHISVRVQHIIAFYLCWLSILSE
jgi:hypothetical protein